MALTNYTTFIAAVADWLDRTDLTSQIPDFLTLAELRMNDDLQLQSLETTEEFTATAATYALSTLTNTLQEFRELHVAGDSGRALEYMTPSALRARYPSSIGNGQPVAFTIEGETLRFAPQPDVNYTMSITYRYRPAVLGVSNLTNEYLPTHADALLYATLLESAPYLVDEKRVGTWGALYDKAVARINEQEAKKTRTQATMRVRLRHNTP